MRERGLAWRLAAPSRIPLTASPVPVPRRFNRTSIPGRTCTSRRSYSPSPTARCKIPRRWARTCRSPAARGARAGPDYRPSRGLPWRTCTGSEGVSRRPSSGRLNLRWMPRGTHPRDASARTRTRHHSKRHRTRRWTRGWTRRWTRPHPWILHPWIHRRIPPRASPASSSPTRAPTNHSEPSPPPRSHPPSHRPYHPARNAPCSVAAPRRGVPSCWIERTPGAETRRRPPSEAKTNRTPRRLPRRRSPSPASRIAPCR
mmetsp:Transcript_543/g.2519  ORF Transcript_543/g.2519 Transcript_543/m.2519 type:complete len:258 (+) Transcript_543:236-1009(+)